VTIYSVDTCQAFSVVRIGRWAGVMTSRLFVRVRLAGEVVRPSGPTLAPGDRVRASVGAGIAGWSLSRRGHGQSRRTGGGLRMVAPWAYSVGLWSGLWQV
jgi:hypothetical protein